MFPTVDNSRGRNYDAQLEQDRFVEIDDDYTLDVNENVVHVTGFSAAVAVTLPPVGKCAGRVFAITCLDDSDTNNITVQDQDDSLDWTDQVIDNANGGSVLLWCDGQKFWVIFAELTAPA